MREHICIRREEYVAGTSARPEVGVFTQAIKNRKPSPWGQIPAGETVWMKWSGGPIVAKAVISGYRQLEHCTPDKLRMAVSGFALHKLDAYWKSLPATFNAIAIYLTDEAWIDPVEVTGRSYSSSWIVLPGRVERQLWFTKAPKKKWPEEKDPRGPRTAGAALRFFVFRRDSYTCQYCARKAPEFVLHVDHITAWSRGGKTELSNLRTACSVCNIGKSDDYA